MKLNLSFKNRSIGFYLRIAVAALAIIAAIAYLIIDLTVIKGNISFQDFTSVVVPCAFVGGLLVAANAFTGIMLLDLAGTVLLAISLGQHLSMSCYPWADMATGVPFFVNNGALASTVSSIYTAFVVLFAVLMLASTVGTFMDRD
ncbi:MAG: hypothetical protein MJ241_04145 [Bacilli bacterium]|nr:hypothetical protein [Bacilli bacterium]